MSDPIKDLEEMKLWDLTDRLTRMFYPIPKTQDKYCPHIEWMGEDLIRCPGWGEWKCKLSTYRYGEYNHNLDYNPCNSPDREECTNYIQQHEKPK